MASTNRTGRVSSIDYESGTYEVTYFDRGRSVTRKINAMSNGEYKMPVVGQVVSVSHNSNGTAAATTTGTVWNKTNAPAEGYKGLYRKEFASRKGQAYDRYDENTGVYTQYVDKRTGRTCNGEIFDEAKGPISLIAGGQIQVKSSGSSIGLNAKTGMGIVAGTSVSIEAGTTVSIESTGSMGVETGKNLTVQVDGKTDVTLEKDAKLVAKGKVELEIEGEATVTMRNAIRLIAEAGVEIEVTGEAKVMANGATVTISEAGDVTVTSPTKIELTAPEINATADAGDLTIHGISLVNHTHKDGGSGPPDK